MADPYQYEINHMEKTHLIGEAVDLVCTARRANTREHWAALSAAFNEQMEEWKEIGSGDGARTRWKDNDEDDVLWEEFSSYREEFKELRDEWFENERARKSRELQPFHQQSAAAKQALINNIKALTDAEPFEADKAAELLFAEWKKVGHAGDHEAALWSAFNACRRSIKDKKKAIVEGRKAKLEDAFAKKKAIIQEVTKLCESSDWELVSRRHKELHQAWKAAGGTGKIEPALWDDFKSWIDKSRLRRVAIQRGEADPFPPPVALPRQDISVPVPPPIPNEKTSLAAAAPVVTSSATATPNMAARPRQRRQPAYWLAFAIVVITACAYALPLAERPLPRQVPEVAEVRTPGPSDPKSVLSCPDYQTSRARVGRTREVGCNSQTALGYYWAVTPSRTRPYGYWGMRGVGATPACRSPADIGKRAETAVFRTASSVWEVRAYWCRQTQQHKDCHGRRDEGPVFSAGMSSEGVFTAVCTEQP